MKSDKIKSPERIAFTKELFGYKYKWKTKDGDLKHSRKKGLMESEGCERLGESAILVPIMHKKRFDTLFKKYKNILKIRAFEINKEIPIG